MGYSGVLCEAGEDEQINFNMLRGKHLVLVVSSNKMLTEVTMVTGLEYSVWVERRTPHNLNLSTKTASMVTGLEYSEPCVGRT